MIMRTIKFRGKDIKNGEWVVGDLHLLCDRPHIHTQKSHYPFAGERYFVVPETIGQYTGLSDKNGKEIYEGDIVNVVEIGGQCRKIPAQIVYDEDMACFNFKASDRDRCMCVSIPDVTIEVIGNIHDNPNFFTLELNDHGAN